MFKNIEDWQSNPKLEVDGVPIDLGRSRVLYVRRAGGANRAFTVALAECLRRVIGEREPEDVPDEEVDEELKALYAEHVVCGWDGFIGEDDKPVPYSKAAFLELIALAPDIWIKVRAFAKTRDSFQSTATIKALKRDKESLGKSSRGKRNGGHSAHV